MLSGITCKPMHISKQYILLQKHIKYNNITQRKYFTRQVQDYFTEWTTK